MKYLLLAIIVLLGCASVSVWASSCETGASLDLEDFVATPRKGAVHDNAAGPFTFSVPRQSLGSVIMFDRPSGTSFSLTNVSVTFTNVKKLTTQYFFEDDSCDRLKSKTYDVKDTTHLKMSFQEPKTMDTFFLRFVPKDENASVTFTVLKMSGCASG